MHADSMGSRGARWWLPLVAAAALLLSACSGASGAGDAGTVGTADTGDVATSDHALQARRAAAQLEVEALPGADGGPLAGRELDPPLVTPDFELTDTAGAPFDFREDADRPVTLVYFGYASCPDVCPTHMAAIARALDEVPAATADDVQVLFVSVDPVNDTPEQLRAYLDNFGDGDRFVGLTGTADQVNAALRSVGLAPTAISDAEQFPPEHPSDILAYTADGRAHVVYPFGTSPTAYVDDLPALISGDWRT
jgi:protein SCO1/2